MKWNNNAKKDALCLKELLKKRVLCYSHKFAFIPLIHCIILHTIRIALRCLKITFNNLIRKNDLRNYVVLKFDVLLTKFYD